MNTVMIKSFQHGIRVKHDPEADFDIYRAYREIQCFGEILR